MSNVFCAEHDDVEGRFDRFGREPCWGYDQRAQIEHR